MISNILLGTDDLESAEKFFNPILNILGATKTRNTDRAIVWNFSQGSTGFAVTLPHDGEASTSGNGTMVGITASSEEVVKAAYNKAIELGGSCAGEPGERVPGVYAAYFRDSVGNKIGMFYKS
jgi:predicted enzyme related to lactoylglutathione lyase